MTVFTCLCHQTCKRKFSFETSVDVSRQPCWCGLLVWKDKNDTKVDSQVLSNSIEASFDSSKEPQTNNQEPISLTLLKPSQHIPLPVYFNAKFWKVPTELFQKFETSLNYVFGDLNPLKYVYLVSNYIVGPVLGRGSKGKVRRGFMKIDNSHWIPVAIKFIFPMSRCRERVPVFNALGLKELISGWTRVKVEWSLQSMMNHPNISQIIELLWNPVCNVWILIMEFGETLIAHYDSKLKMYRQGVSQQKIVNHVPTLSEIGCKNLLKQILNAVIYLHEHQIVHKDLKPENILISSSSLPKEWLKTITPSLDLLDKEETYVETQPYGDTRDWEEMSDCTEEFLWDIDPFQVNSFEDYTQQINIEMQRYHKCQLCLCCSMKNATMFSSTPYEGGKLPILSNFFVNGSKAEDSNEYQKCLCCNKLLHHPLHVVKNFQSDLKICIIDFSSAVQVKEPDFHIYDADGTRQFTPPECIMSLNKEKKIFGFARDAWSIGCLLYCLLLGKLPFECETPVNVYFNIKHGLQKPLPNWLSEDVKDLIMGLLNPKPEERFSLHQCLNHSWFHT